MEDVESGGLSDFEMEGFARAGIGPDEAVVWKAAGVGPYPAQRAVELGLTIEQASVGLSSGWFPTAVRQLLDRGIPPEDLEMWEPAGGDVSFVIWALDRGLDHVRFANLVTVFRDLERLGVDQRESQRWFDEGIDVGVVGHLLREGLNPSQVLDQAGFLGLVDSPDDRASWITLSRFVALTPDMLGRSLTPLEVLWGRDEHAPKFVPPDVFFDSSMGEYRRVDDGVLPLAMTAPKSRRISVDELRSLGSAVHEVDPAALFLDDNPEAIVVKVQLPSRSTDGKKSKPLKTSVLGITIADDGTWQVIRISGQQLGSTGPFESQGAAIDGVAVLVGEAGRLTSVESLSSSSTDLLEMMLPAAKSIHGRTIQLNDRKVGVEIDLHGNRHLVPRAPKKWPGYRKVTPAHFLVGRAAFVELRSGQIVPVGLAGATSDDAVIQLAREAISSIVKVETTVKGESRATEVRRKGQSTFEYWVDGEFQSALEAASIGHVLSALSELGTVRGGLLTEFVTSPLEDLDDHELLDMLVIDSSHISASQVVESIESVVDIPQWAREFLECSSGDLDYLPIAINDSRVISVESGGGPVAILAKSLDQGGEPIFVEEWISHGWCQSASMTSGYFGWRVGLIRPGIVCEWWDPDEDSSEISLYDVTEDQRLPFIVEWLTRGPGSNLDLAMYAVEKVAGGDAFDWSGSVEVGAEFDDNAGESLETDLSIRVADSEIEEFFELLRAAGRGDAVDAVRSPGSEAWERRQARIKRLMGPN